MITDTLMRFKVICILINVTLVIIEELIRLLKYYLEKNDN